MKHADALALAQGLVEALTPVCSRIEIAGSVRRGKEQCGDLEIVAIAKYERQQTMDLFGEVAESVTVNVLEQRLPGLFELGEWGLDLVLRRNGVRYKRLLHYPTWMCCDLFIVTQAGWGGAMVIRTGPAEFSRAVVTLALRLGKHVADGYLLHGHAKLKDACPRGADCPLIIPTLEEADFLAALGLPWMEPGHRTAQDAERARRGDAKAT